MDPSPISPYAPPESNLARFEPFDPDTQTLADLPTRFAGALLDSLVYLAVLVPAFISIATTSQTGDYTSGQSWPMLGIGAVALINAVLISTSGQSIAKRLLRMRIVKLDGSPCGFVHGVLLRSWVVALIGGVPLVGALFSLADPLFIFGEERRCLHDYMAGTRVVSVPRE